MPESWGSLTIDDRSLTIAFAVLSVSVIGIFVAVIPGRSQSRALRRIEDIEREHLALEQGRTVADRYDDVVPTFELKVDPARHPGTNPRLSITCAGGSQTYQVDADMMKDLGFPTAIALIGDDLNLWKGTARPWVYKRYRLGRFENGETHWYSVQPPLVSSRADDRAHLRLTATAVEDPAMGSAWQSTYPYRVLYWNPSSASIDFCRPAIGNTSYLARVRSTDGARLRG